MSVQDLYQNIVLRHFKSPANFGSVEDGELLAAVENPNCGDRLRLTLTLDRGRIAGVRFDGRGCAISIASCSLMTERVKGKTPEEARALRRAFEAMLRGVEEGKAALGDLVALENVKRYPLRIRCALLGWDALEQALRRLEGGPVSPARN